VIDLKLFLKTSNEGILSRGTWVTFAFATIINLANHFTTTFILCTFVKFTREKTQKQKAKT